MGRVGLHLLWVLGGCDPSFSKQRGTAVLWNCPTEVVLQLFLPFPLWCYCSGVYGNYIGFTFLFGEAEECISNGGNDAFVFFYMSSLLL